MERARDCYTRDENDPLNGCNAQYIPTNEVVEVFLTFRFESGRVALVASRVPGSFDPNDFVNGDINDFNFD